MPNINFSPGALSYRGGARFNDKYNPTPGPGSYSPPQGVNTSFEKFKGGKWGLDQKKDMTIRSSLENPGPGSYKIMRDFGNY